jgi:hypothetical protein
MKSEKNPNKKAGRIKRKNRGDDYQQKLTPENEDKEKQAQHEEEEEEDIQELGTRSIKEQEEELRRQGYGDSGLDEEAA